MFWNGSTAIDGLLGSGSGSGSAGSAAGASVGASSAPPPADDGAAARGLLLHLADEAESALVDRADHLLRAAVVADHAPRRADARVERRIRHHAALPHRLEQLVLADDAVAVLQQIGEHVEHLRLDRHGLPGAAQFLLHQVNLVSAEPEIQDLPPFANTNPPPPAGTRVKSVRRWLRRPQNTTISKSPDNLQINHAALNAGSKHRRPPAPTSAPTGRVAALLLTAHRHAPITTTSTGLPHLMRASATKGYDDEHWTPIKARNVAISPPSRRLP